MRGTIAVWLPGPVPMMVIVAAVLCEFGMLLQPPTKVAIVTKSITVNANCKAPR